MSDPPPDPAQAPLGDLQAPAPRGPGAGERIALMSDRALNWVSNRTWWATGLLWLFLFPFLLPLLVFARTGGSRNGLLGGTALFVMFMIIGAAGGEPEQSDPVTASDAGGDDTAADAAPAPSPTPSVTSEPSAIASPTASDPAPSPSSTANEDSEPSPDAAATEGRSSSPRGDDAPVIRQGRVSDVVDGDTFELDDGTTVRIAIADTPEVSFGVEACGPEASQFTASFLAGRTVAIYRPQDAPQFDPNGRLLGEVVRVDDGASLNVALVRAGLARVDERFTDEDADLAARLRAAADAAQDPDCERQGEPSPAQPGSDPGGSDDSAVTIVTVRADGPGNDVEFENDSEYVELRNGGDADVDLGGWALTDEAGHRHRVPTGFTIPAGGTFRVYSGDGDDGATSRYFLGLGQAWLNNDGDTINLVDPGGAEVDSYSY